MRMTVGRKLAALTLVALAGIGGLAVASMHDLARVHDAANLANATALPRIAALGNAERSLALVRIELWRHLAASGGAQMAEIDRAIAEHRRSADEALSRYEPLLLDDQDRRLLADDRAAVDGGDELRDKALALSRAGDKAAARELLSAGAAVFERLDRALAAHRQYHADLAEQRSTEAAGLKAAATRTGIAIAALTLLLAAALGVFITRQLLSELGGEPGEVAAVANRVAGGDLAGAIRLRPGDESSALAAMARLQRDVKARSEREQLEGAANARVRSSLDQVATSVMIADADGTVVYANEALKSLLRSRTADMRREVAGLDPERLLGVPLEALEWIPAGERARLAGLSGTHSAEIGVGEVRLRMTATAVADADGRRVGTAVQWLDRTDEVRTEEELQAVVVQALGGDLTRRIPEAGKSGFLAALARGMNALLDDTADLVHQVAAAANAVAGGAEEISRGNANLSQRTEEQASSLEETASSMEEMTATVKQNADNAAQANQLAAAARGQAEKGGEVVASAVHAMGEINTASKRIADIISVIDEIAFQTNLLALNAAVEAARAGEQGRGFAVVASEVRNLASRSAQAAKEIKSLIQDSVGKVEEGSRLVDASGRTLTEIVAAVKKVTDIVGEIAAASSEQAAGIEQVNRAVLSMDEVTQQNASLVEQAAAAAEALKEQSAQLKALLAHYSVGESATAATRSPATPTAPQSAPPPGVAERRGAGRPWSGPGPAASERAPAAEKVRPARTAKAAEPPGDADWKDF